MQVKAKLLVMLKFFKSHLIYNLFDLSNKAEKNDMAKKAPVAEWSLIFGM